MIKVYEVAGFGKVVRYEDYLQEKESKSKLIELAMQKKELNITSLAQSLGMTKGNLSYLLKKIKSGESVRSNHLMEISKKLEIPIEKLI